MEKLKSSWKWVLLGWIYPAILGNTFFIFSSLRVEDYCRFVFVLALFSYRISSLVCSRKPDSEKMGSTDTGDYFPEGYNPEEEIAFSSGMMGSQSGQGDRDGPQLVCHHFVSGRPM